MENKKKNKVIFYLINLLIILVVSGLTIYKMVSEKGVETLSHLKELSFLSLVILTTMFFVNYYLEGIIISLAMRKHHQGFNPSQGFIVQCVGGLFSAITPLKVGYLPSIAYAYSKFNVKAESLINSMAKTGFTYQIYCLIISLVAYGVCSYKTMIIDIGEVSLDLKFVAIIGLIYNAVLMIGYLILILSPTLHNFLLRILAWILFKIKKIDNKEIYYETQKKKMGIIRSQIRMFLKNFKEFLILFVLYLFKNILFGGLPYVIYLLVTKSNFDIQLWLYTVVLGHLVSYITNIVPIPGASGAAEVVFVAVFSLAFSPSTLLTSIMLVWRIFSYFINIIVGFLVFVIMIYVKERKKEETIVQ